MTETRGVRTANENVEPLLLTEERAYVRSNIVAIDEPGSEEMPGFKGYSYDEVE